jgi:hypothetical protein
VRRPGSKKDCTATGENYDINYDEAMELDGRGSRTEEFSERHSVQTDPGAQPSSYPVGTDVSSPTLGQSGRGVELTIDIPLLHIRLYDVVLN